jgi:hypothetical protein
MTPVGEAAAAVGGDPEIVIRSINAIAKIAS